MMASKRLSIEEQIEKKEESIKQLQNQKRQLKKKLNEQERKARNKRLIEKGAVFESIFEESIDLTKDEFYKLIKTLNDEEIRLNIMEILEERIDDNVEKSSKDEITYRMYDKIDELESSLIDAKAKKQTIEAEKLTGDNIYKVLIYFDKLYKVMNDVERRQLISALISEIQVYEEKQSNGQWLKSITFKLPIIEENLNIDLDNDEQVECVSLLEKRS